MHKLISGGAVFGSDGTVTDGLGVMLEGDIIKEIAPLATFDGYEGSIVDSSGATLLPGLVDCHVHLCFKAGADPKSELAKLSDADIALTALKNAENTLAGGMTAVRDCGGKDYLEFAARDAINRGEFPGPTIYAAGRMICMTGGHGNNWGRVADGPDEVIKAVREQVHRGSDLIKIMATGGVMTPGVNPEDAHYSAEEMRAGIQEARRFHKRTASHAQGTEGILNAVHGGIHSIEHGIFMTDQCIEAMLESGTYLVPTLAALQYILMGADKGIPELIVEKTKRVSEIHQQSIKAFHKAGGKIAMGTDAGTPFNRHGENAMELKFMTDLGVSPKDAILAATAGGSDLMGLSDSGVIETGKRADLLIVEGNPLDDIMNIADRANHRLVMKDGKIVV